MIENFTEFWNQALEIWISGGWSMIAIAINAVVMFALAANIHFKLREKGFRSVPETTWRRWIDNPQERVGPIGKLLDSVTEAKTVKDSAVSFQELMATEVKPFERDLKVMNVCISASPLLGLLGTVSGMLATFGALAAGSGGDKTMGLVAQGISEALITTETGLVMALPGLFLRYRLSRRHGQYKAFLAHLETVCNQKLYKKINKERQD